MIPAPIGLGGRRQPTGHGRSTALSESQLPNLLKRRAARMIQASHSRTNLQAVLIGIGSQGLRRVQAMRMTEGWRLVGVYDADKALAATVARRLGCRAFTHAAEAVACPVADVVTIATPPYAHDDLIAAALGSFKHVLCEKPLTIRPESAARLTQEAQRRGLVLATGFNHRFYGPVRDALALARSGRLGRLRQIQAHIGHPPDAAALEGWLGDAARSGGGVVVDNGSHLIDLIRLFLGEIERVESRDFQWHRDKPGIETHASLRFEAASGAVAEAECSWVRTGRPYLGMNLSFERGQARLSAFPWRLEIEGLGPRLCVRRYLADRVVSKAMGLKASGLEPSLVHELSSLRQAILSETVPANAVPLATGEDGLAAARIVAAIREHGRPNRVPAPHWNRKGAARVDR